MALSHDSRAPLTTKSHLELDVSSFSAWCTGRRPHSRSLGLATCSPHSRPAYPYQARSPRPHCALVFNIGSVVVRAAAALPPRHACQGSGPMLAARGTVYRHAILCGTVARITIATRPPRAAPTRHVTIRGCVPGATGAGSQQVRRFLSAKPRACGRASVPGYSK